jgi:O-antigen biosynthesis alpha-1,2-rhamnosyltransferase
LISPSVAIRSDGGVVLSSSRRIYVECTHTFFSGGNTGIRRVARNLAKCAAAASDSETQLIPVVWGGIGFFTPKKRLSEAPHFLQRVRRGVEYLQALVGKMYQATPTPLRRPFTWFKHLLMRMSKPRAVSELVFLFLGVGSFPFKFLFGSSVVLRKGDIVVLVDSTWNSNRMLEYLFRAQGNAGIMLGAMIHDLFPLTLPETCEPETIDGFSSWFKRIAPAVDFFVTNSEATRSALDNYLRANPEIRPHRWRTGSFPLGAELDLYVHDKGASGNTQTIWSTPGVVILAVGTIEPRKNYGLVLDAFDRLYAKHLPVSLIIVGRPGWKSEAVLQRMKLHPAFGKELLHLTDASDFDLAQAFERADCMVCSSLGEGFGLPLVEGLMHGLTVFASDIPPFREIGGQALSYFPVDSPEGLADLLENHLKTYRRDAAARGMAKTNWPNWAESTRLFSRRILELADSSESVEPV